MSDINTQASQPPSKLQTHPYSRAFYIMADQPEREAHVVDGWQAQANEMMDRWKDHVNRTER